MTLPATDSSSSSSTSSTSTSSSLLYPIIYAATVVIVLVLSICYICNVYRKSRRGDYYNNEYNSNSNANSTSNNALTTSNTGANTSVKKEPNNILQLCSITVLDEPLIGTIRMIDKVTGENTTTTTTVADFGNQVTIELDNEENETTCSICLNDYALNDAIFRNDPSQCRHIFHTTCILTWIQQRNNNNPTPECPCCRSNIAVTKQIEPFDDTTKNITNDDDDDDDDDDDVAIDISARNRSNYSPEGLEVLISRV